MPVRIAASEFIWTKSFRRVVRNNEGLSADENAAIATIEQFQLFSAYQQKRHNGGEMSGMEYADYRAMIEDTTVSSRTVEFRDEEGAFGRCYADGPNERGPHRPYIVFSTRPIRNAV